MNKNLEKALQVFKDGGVVIFPTDTAVGIGCRIDNEKAVKRVFDIKKRSFNEALLVLVDSVEMAEKYVNIRESVREKLINKYWPGGLTIFFECKKKKVPSIVRAGSDILAVRWPNHPEIESLIKKVGVPVIATSANISGEATPYAIGEVNQSLIEQVDFVMEGECVFKKESTIIDTTVTPWKTVRQGVVEVNI